MGRTIAIALHNGLGDVFMSLPLIRSCDDQLGPEDTLILLMKSSLEAEAVRLLNWRSRIETWPLYDGESNRWRLFQIALALRARRPDVYINAHGRSDRFLVTLWSRIVGAALAVGEVGPWWRLGFHRAVPRPKVGTHKVEHLLEFGERAGFRRPATVELRVPIPDSERAAARARMPGWAPNQQWVILAPGSGEREAHKRWPPERFRSLARDLLATGPEFRIAVFGSPKERPLLDSIASDPGVDSTRCTVFTGDTLRESLAFLAEGHCLVGGCSGSSHMATAVGLPTVGLFGPTNPGYTGAHNPRLRVLRLGLRCSPCLRPGFDTGCGTPLCMIQIEPRSVLRAVLETLNGVPAPPIPWQATTRALGPDANDPAVRNVGTASPDCKTPADAVNSFGDFPIPAFANTGVSRG